MSHSVDFITNDLVNCTSSDSPKDAVKESTPSTPHYSRSCPVCLMESPRQRSFFSGCGHIICRACAVQLAVAASATWKQPSCPLCRKDSYTRVIIEDKLHDYDQFLIAIRQDRMNVINENLLRESIEQEERESLIREQCILKVLNEEMDMRRYYALYDASLWRVASDHGDVTLEHVLQAEGRRLDDMLPFGLNSRQWAIAAFRAVWRNELLSLVDHLRAEDESSATADRQCSRACHVCDLNEPRLRSVFTDCGHVFCRSCAESTNACYCCRRESKSVALFENIIEVTENEAAV